MAIAFDASSQGNQDSGTSLTYSHTTTGSNRYLITFVRLSSASDLITGITYNGVAMTQRANVLNADSNRRLYVYDLIAPATGANDVVISASSTTSFRGHTYSYTGVQQSGQPDAVASNAPASTTTPSIDLTIVVANSWAAIGGANATADPTSTTGWSTRISAGGQATGDTNADQTAGLKTYSFTYAGAVTNAQIAMSFSPFTTTSTSTSTTSTSTSTTTSSSTSTSTTSTSSSTSTTSTSSSTTTTTSTSTSTTSTSSSTSTTSTSSSTTTSTSSSSSTSTTSTSSTTTVPYPFLVDDGDNINELKFNTDHGDF